MVFKSKFKATYLVSTANDLAIKCVQPILVSHFSFQALHFTFWGYDAWYFVQIITFSPES